MPKKLEVIVTADDKTSKAFDSAWKNSWKLADKIKQNMWKIRLASWIALAWFGAIWKSLLDRWKDLELMDKKATVVLWNFRKEVEETARVVANRMWMTSFEFVSATAKISDLLVPMWFAREQAVWMSSDLVELSGALAERSDWQYNASETSEILAKAILGETEQMKALWIKIDQTSKAFNERIKAIMDDTGATLEQAKAMDIQNQIMEKSTDAQKAYAEGAWSLSDLTWRMNTSFKDVKDTLALALLPVFIELTEVILPVIQQFADRVKENPERAKNILLVAWAITAVVFALSTFVPMITTAVAVLSWPAWLVIAIGAVFGALKILEWNIISTEDKITNYKEQMKLLDEQFKNWKISLDEYTTWMNNLKTSINEAQIESENFWQFMTDSFDGVLKDITNPVQWFKDAMQDLWIITQAVWWAFDRLAEYTFNLFMSKLDQVRKTIQTLRESVLELVAFWWQVVSSVSSKIQDTFSRDKKEDWQRAIGWTVSSNWSYLVGERWPEMFVPSTAWKIVPNQSIQWKSSPNITVNLWGVVVKDQADEQRLANTIIETIKRQWQLYQQWIN